MAAHKLPNQIYTNTILFSKSVSILMLQTIVTIALTKPSVAPTHLLVTRVGPCYDSQKTMVAVSEMSLVRDVYDSLLSGKVNISEDVDDGWNVKATMQKCRDIRNLATCDFLKSFTVVTSGCVDSDDKDLYITFFHYLEPRLKCPLQAGSYGIKEFPLVTEDSYIKAAESKISTSVFGYTYRLEGFDKHNERILCLDAYMQLMYSRKHKWGTSWKLENTSLPADEDVNDADDNTSEE